MALKNLSSLNKEKLFLDFSFIEKVQKIFKIKDKWLISLMGELLISTILKKTTTYEYTLYSI